MRFRRRPTGGGVSSPRPRRPWPGGLANGPLRPDLPSDTAVCASSRKGNEMGPNNAGRDPGSGGTLLLHQLSECKRSAVCIGVALRMASLESVPLASTNRGQLIPSAVKCHLRRDLFRWHSSSAAFTRCACTPVLRGEENGNYSDSPLSPSLPLYSGGGRGESGVFRAGGLSVVLYANYRSERPRMTRQTSAHDTPNVRA